MKSVVCLLVLTLLFCFKAEAMGAGSVVYGWGAQSCGAWTKAQANRPMLNPSGLVAPTPNGPNFISQHQWVLAFISAYNVYQGATPDVTKGTDANGLFAWMDNYCAAHPLNMIGTAVIDLIAELS